MVTARSMVDSCLVKYYRHFKSPSFPPFVKGEEGGFILSSNLTHLLCFWIMKMSGFWSLDKGKTAAKTTLQQPEI